MKRIAFILFTLLLTLSISAQKKSAEQAVCKDTKESKNNKKGS